MTIGSNSSGQFFDTSLNSNGTLYATSAGVIASTPNGTTGQVWTANTGSPPGWANSATSGTVTTVSVVSANGFAGTVANATTTPAITISTSITGVLSGNGTAISGSAVTQYDVLVGGASNAISSVGPGTSGQLLQSGGNAANPAYTTATYPSSTTLNNLLFSSSANVVGQISAGNYGVLISGSTGIPSWLANGTTGQILTATTSGTPSWSSPAAGGITTINGDSGSITGSTVTIYANNAGNICGSSVLFSNSGTTSTLQVTDSNFNTIIGLSAGKAGITGSDNVGLGRWALLSLTSGTQNVALGYSTLANVTSHSANVAVGYTCLSNALGSNNTAIGNAAGVLLSGGSDNILIGNNSASNYSGNEGSNIIIGNAGTGAESHVVRIGTQGSSTAQQNKCFIAGITGVTVTGAAVLCDGTGLLGTVASSQQYKTNIQDLKEDNFIKLRPVSFKYKKQDNDDIHYGMIAEEVEKICPDLVLYKDGKPDSIKYHEMPALLLAEIQKLKVEINDLKASLKK